LLYGAYAGTGPAFKNKWLKTFWTFNFGGGVYGILPAAGNYGFTYLAGPYASMILRIPHNDESIKRAFVLTTRYTVLMESPSNIALNNNLLSVTGEFWFNPKWAAKLQWESLFYQSQTSQNLLQWSHYSAGVSYAP